MIMRDAVVEGSGNFDHLGFFNVHPNLSTKAYSSFTSIENGAAAAGIDTAICGARKDTGSRRAPEDNNNGCHRAVTALSPTRDRWSAHAGLAHHAIRARRTLSYQTRAKAWSRTTPLRPEVCRRRHALAGRRIRATGPPAARANMDEGNSEPQTKKRRRLEPPQTSPVAVAPDGQVRDTRDPWDAPERCPSPFLVFHGKR
ncbi:hypothetical protein HPB51_009620 [Rhipicephalus microplus]|uniref:Uncharacterized protein n=1 Tax=Rhipicephalus microplus TaxID=6941 RepID=A0A9J6DMD7_RHIMP|nr:hypothetical protein HPB51_009620 [Rhipicephalus microplus]